MAKKEVTPVKSEEETPRDETRKLEPGVEAAKSRTRRRETKILEEESEMALQSVPAPHLGLTREETSWAAVAHASMLVTLLLGLVTGGLGAILGPIIPALIWYAYRDKSDYVVDQARQATVFQLAGFAALLLLGVMGAILVGLGWAVSAVLVIVLVGLLLLPIMLVATMIWVVALVALPIVQVVYGCYAALEAYHGRPFRYWWIADLVDRYQAQA